MERRRRHCDDFVMTVRVAGCVAGCVYVGVAGCVLYVSTIKR